MQLLENRAVEALSFQHMCKLVNKTSLILLGVLNL